MKKRSETVLPGEELAAEGLRDIARGDTTEMSLLVLIAGPRLRRLGIHVPDLPPSSPYEHQLYARLEDRLGPGAHSYYNSLIRRMVSYARALERESSGREERSA